MDIEHVYKTLKQEHDTLVQREQELAAKIRDVKALRDQVANRKVNVDKLQEELNRLLGA